MKLFFGASGYAGCQTVAQDVDRAFNKEVNFLMMMKSIVFYSAFFIS